MTADYFVHPRAICETRKIGAGTRIWPLAYILEGAEIGRDANICSHTFIEADVVIGDRVTVKSGVQLWNGVRLEDDVFVGPNVTFTNDLFPRSKTRPEEFVETVVSRGASIGANATILAGVHIGQRAMVGAGAVVTRPVPPNAVVFGNPARIQGYVEAEKGDQIRGEAPDPGTPAVRRSVVENVTIHRFPLQRDMRGSLVAAECGPDIPFTPKRSFIVFDVPGSEIRGEHAHRTCHQFLMCVRGSCSLVVDDGRAREEFQLDAPTLGVYIPPWVWATQFRHSPDAMLLVMASHPYDPDDYIRDYQRFLDEVVGRRA